jgi:hypothetical protein
MPFSEEKIISESLAFGLEEQLTNRCLPVRRSLLVTG